MIFNSFSDFLSNSDRLPNQIWWKVAVGISQLSCCLGLMVSDVKPATAAEKIILSYGALEFSVSVTALETYAKTGKLEGALRSYADLLTPEQLEQLKIGLNTNANLDHLAIAQFLYSFQGEKLLERISRVIKTEARQPGFYALRSALILAAADPDVGLTPLNAFKKFPTDVLRIDSREGFEIVENLGEIVRQNSQAIAAVERESMQELQAIDNAPLLQNLDLLNPGEDAFNKEVLLMRDRNRSRVFPTELYLPQTKSKKPWPLIVISHGLGSDLTTFAYLAEHLASHGFAVAVPEHPGSSARQIEALLSGLKSDVTPPEELIDRPLDIKFLLDRLTQKYGTKLDTTNVGVIGQSFGAYTTLALAGAELNWKTLEDDCSTIDSSWNLSWLIQCLALQLSNPIAQEPLRDERITAAIAINPLVSSIFGRESLKEIEIPVMLVSGSDDPITPALTEQIVPFTWLTTANKYLLLLQGGTHFSTLNESAGSIPVPKRAIGPDPKIAQNYLKQMGLAFFGRYINRQQTYANYLNAAYGAVISKPNFPLRLIESLELDFAPTNVGLRKMKTSALLKSRRRLATPIPLSAYRQDSDPDLLNSENPT